MRLKKRFWKRETFSREALIEVAWRTENTVQSSRNSIWSTENYTAFRFNLSCPQTTHVLAWSWNLSHEKHLRVSKIWHDAHVSHLSAPSASRKKIKMARARHSSKDAIIFKMRLKLIRLYPCGSLGQSISFIFGVRVGHFASTPQSDVVGIIMVTWFGRHGDAFGTTENAFFRAFMTLRSQFHLHHRSQQALTEIVTKITPNLGLVL